MHSMLTWLAWIGSKLIMAAWLDETNGRQVNRAIEVTAVNSSMGLAACVLTAWYR